jgi:hypothetical protein
MAAFGKEGNIKVKGKARRISRMEAWKERKKIDVRISIEPGRREGGKEGRKGTHLTT